MVPEAEDGPAEFLKRLCSLPVVRSGEVFRVLKPIQLDDDLMCWTGEINDISGNWQLPSERETIKAMSTDGVPEL